MVSRDNDNDQYNVEPPQRMLHGFGCNLFSVSTGADRIVCGGEEGVVQICNFSEALEIQQKAYALRGIRLEKMIRRRRLQIEMNDKSDQMDQYSIASRSSVWHSKRGITSKVKT